MDRASLYDPIATLRVTLATTVRISVVYFTISAKEDAVTEAVGLVGYK